MVQVTPSPESAGAQTSRMMPNAIPAQVPGLSEREAARRLERGLGNGVHFRASRTYVQIIRQNGFTFINIVLFTISLILILMGQSGDALVTAGLVLLNVLVGVFQEGRAKQKLERIALLTRPRATVIRDGQEKRIDPDRVVLGDLLVAHAGDQIVADGSMVDAHWLEVDESLLTGESERVLKHCGDPVHSGTFCVAGTARYQARHVGGNSLANQITARARRVRQVKTPLQRDIDQLIRILVLLVSQLGILLGLSFIVNSVAFVEAVRVAAVIVALVPQGLFFMTTIAYAMGAVRVAGKGTLIQKANAVESTSCITLLCLDKTGTLTTNKITFHAIRPVADIRQDGQVTLAQIVGDYAASTSTANQTTEAMRRAFGGVAAPLQVEVPFSSQRGWSALAFDDPARPGMYFLGAPEIVELSLQRDSQLPQSEDWTNQGLRLLLLAYHPYPAPPSASGKLPQLPDGLIPLALLSFEDELRPEARETLAHFARLGVHLKIISGDNPRAVAALARQIGMDGDLQVVSGLQLDAMDDAELQEVARQATIFGRITPQQKEQLVRLFRGQGHYVAMIGDGVNDVLPLKQAHLGVAMQSGSAATRSVADMVLLGDSFAALPIALREGQRIVKGMEDVVRLLLTRTFYILLLVVATRLIGVPFPVTPKHNSILALLTIGIPILAIAAWARPARPRRILQSTRHFVFPAAFTVAAVSLVIYLAYLALTGDVTVARTVLTTTSVLCGLVLICFVEPPTKAWVGGDDFSGDWRPTLLAIAMLALFSVVMTVPALRTFFELTPLRSVDYLLIGGAVTGWALSLRFVWRAQLFERLLGRTAEQEFGPVANPTSDPTYVGSEPYHNRVTIKSTGKR